MDKRNLFITSVTILVASQVASCQRTASNGSDVKTLDQMASGSGSNYSCAADGQSPASSYVSTVAMQRVFVADGSKCSDSKNSSTETCRAMKDVLNVIAAKSEILVKNYFDTIKGNILLSDDMVAKLCQSSFADPNSPQFVKEDVRSKIDGCWSIPKVSEGVYAVTMNHKANASSIRNNGIRVFGMFYGQAVQQMSMANGKFSYDMNYKPDDGVRKTLWDHKKDLASLFLQDVKAGEAGGQYSLTKLPYLTAAGITKIRAGSAPAVDTSLFDGDISLQRFVDTVMGEAFDSGFCQASQTASANSSTFKNTMKAFNEQILPGLNQLASSMGTAAGASQPADASQPANGAPSKGFGLGAFDSVGGFFSSLATMMTSGGMLGNGVGATNNAAALAYNNLRLNPTNNPQLAGYNPQLAQAANPALPNYNPTLLQQQTMTLQQQASMPAAGASILNPYGTVNPYGAVNPLSSMFGSSNGGILSMFSSMGSSNVCPNGNCSVASGGCSGSGCGGSASAGASGGSSGGCSGGCSNCS